MYDRAEINHLVSDLYDEATGLSTPGLFFDRVNQAMTLAIREHLTLAVAIIHVTYDPSHPQPENKHRIEVGKQLAAQIRQDIRASDTVGLLEPDEVGLLLPHVSPSGLPGVLRRVLSQDNLRIEVDDETFLVTAHVGMALSDASMSDAGDLMERAYGNLARRLDAVA